VSKISASLTSLPPAALQALQTLGENLAIARTRRRESQRNWARRLGISVPTLIRMERGDPTVSAGTYVTALWLMGTVSGLSDLAAPANDRGALETDVRQAIKRRAVRSAASVEARLARGRKISRSGAGVTWPRMSCICGCSCSHSNRCWSARCI
jgi:transcriptional regulator with XRE-family HTH domain